MIICYFYCDNLENVRNILNKSFEIFNSFYDDEVKRCFLKF